jgi:trehalose-6-phosphate synthase
MIEKSGLHRPDQWRAPGSTPVAKPELNGFHVSPARTPDGKLVVAEKPLVAATPSLEVVQKSGFDKTLIVSNRLPIDVDEHGNVKMTIGGLANTINDFLRHARENGEHHNMKWLGWNAKTGEKSGLADAWETSVESNGIEIKGFRLTQTEIKDYYGKMSNEALWMLFHSMKQHFIFDPNAWETYRNTNRKKFAEAVLKENPTPDTLVWVHDYHLPLVADEIRQRKEENALPTLGYFIHIPFPTPDILHRLPEQQRKEILEGFLAHNLVGFQTDTDRNNFIACVKEYLDNQEDPLEIHDIANAAIGIRYKGRTAFAKTFPISINAKGVQKDVLSDEVQEKVAALRKQYEGKTLFVSVQRNDPSKGILESIDVHERLLDEHPSLRETAVYVPIIQKSREGLQVYDDLAKATERRVAEVNSKYPGSIEQLPGQPRNDALAYMSIADQVWALTFKDGMNIVVKEAAAVGKKTLGVVVTEGTGASHELKEHAVVVKDASKTAKVADRVWEALNAPEAEKIQRKDGMQKQVEENDVVRYMRDYMGYALKVR